MTNNTVKTEYAVALGFFDGLHRAHMTVLEKTLEAAHEKGLAPAVMLLDEHPRAVITGEAVPFLQQTSYRDKRLKDMGFTLFSVSFREIKDMAPREFFESVLCERFSARVLVCGYNYNFGKDAGGDTKALDGLCRERGMTLEICPEFTVGGETVSSSSIRSAIENGEIERADTMLGIPFGFCSEVFTGDRRGRLLGAPTINQYLPGELVVPKFGVYASKVYFDGKVYMGVTNIGSRPTFGVSSVRSETYIVDFSGDLYGREVRVELHSFIREERRFPDGDALKKQIAEDVRAAVDRL